MKNKETAIDKHLGGLFLMIIFTIIWTILAEFFFNGLDYGVIGIIFGISIGYLIYNYVILSRRKPMLPEIEKISNPTKDKWYWIIFALEGIAIFVTKNVLVNVDKDNLFVCFFALIVGLHFIPLAKVFDRRFDYYIGTWTTLISIIGLFLIIVKGIDYQLVNALVCTGCAFSTLMYGLNMIRDGQKII